jgi:hypothetical protein
LYTRPLCDGQQRLLEFARPDNIILTNLAERGISDARIRVTSDPEIAFTDAGSWGYDRIAGALANLGYAISDRTVGNIQRRHNLAPAPERSRTTSWKEFIRLHMEVLAGADFFTVEVLTWRGLVTYYVLFFIAVGTRRVCLGGRCGRLSPAMAE